MMLFKYLRLFKQVAHFPQILWKSCGKHCGQFVKMILFKAFPQNAHFLSNSINAAITTT